MRINPERTESRRHTEHLAVIGVPLPLLAYKRRVEFVALNRVLYLYLGRRLGFAVCNDRVAAIVAVLVNAHYRPVVLPGDRLQVYDAAITALVLEVQEPVFTESGVHPRALMRAVDAALALCKHNLMLVRAVNVLGTHSHLEARRHAAGREHYPIPAVTLIELGAFTCAAFGAVAVEHDDGVAYGHGAVGRKLAHNDD